MKGNKYLKRGFAAALCAMLLFGNLQTSGVPFVVTAAENPPAEKQTCEHHIHDEAAETECTYECPVCEVQALIDALPEKDGITKENAEEVTAQINAVLEAVKALDEEQAAMLSMERCTAAADAVSAPGAVNPQDEEKKDEENTDLQKTETEPEENTDVVKLQNCLHHTHDEACGYDVQTGEGCTYECLICKVQALIDALPEKDEITAENAQALESQLMAIDEAKLALTDGQMDQLNFEKYIAAAQALGSVYDVQTLPGEPEDEVFQIGNDKYGTLAAALEAADDGDEIVLLKDGLEITESVTINNAVTLDLNGKTIKLPMAGKNLTIRNNVAIKNGTITGQAKSSYPLIKISGEYSASMENVTVQSSGGTAVQAGSSLYTKTDFTATGCTFERLTDSAVSGSSSMGGLIIYTNGNVSLTGCTFRNGKNKYGTPLQIKNGADSTVTIDRCTISDASEEGYGLSFGDSSIGNTGTTKVTNSSISGINGSCAVRTSFKLKESAKIVFGEGNTVTGPVSVVGQESYEIYQLIVTDGRFDNDGNVPFSHPNDNNEELMKRLNLTGGYYKVDVSDYVANGYRCQEVTNPVDGYKYHVVEDNDATSFYTITEGVKNYYQTLTEAAQAKNGTVYIAEDYPLTADELKVLNDNQTTVSTDHAALYCDSLADLLAAIPNARLENASLSIGASAKMTDVCTEGGKLTGGKGLSKEECIENADLLADGYLFNAQREYAVYDESKCTAKIGGIGYESLYSAVATATLYDKDSVVKEEIILLDDVEESVYACYPKSSFTLNLNGHTITGTDGYGIGIIPSRGWVDYYPNDADITIKNGTVVDGSGYGIVTNGLLNNVKLEMIDLKVTSNAENGGAVYLAAGGSTTITGGEYTGSTGVQICAGNLTIDGAKITATGDGVTEGKTGDGLIPDDAAISIVNRPGYQPLGEVIIKDGTFVAADGINAVNAYYWESNQSSDWSNAGDTIDISGGEYSSGFSDEYLADSVKTVIKRNGMMEAPYVVGTKADEIFSNAKAGDSITIILVDGDIRVPEGVTIDNQTGSNITVNGKTVESNGSIQTEHEMTAYAAKKATCKENGNNAYYYCSLCNKYFENADGTKEIVKDSWVILAVEHQFGEWTITKEAASSETGIKERICSVCGEKETEVIPATGNSGKTDESSSDSGKNTNDAENEKNAEQDAAKEVKTSAGTGINTGDTNNMIFWMSAMIASLAAVAAVIFLFRKKN